jgi:hypothetical protein
MIGGVVGLLIKARVGQFNSGAAVRRHVLLWHFDKGFLGENNVQYR